MRISKSNSVLDTPLKCALNNQLFSDSCETFHQYSITSSTPAVLTLKLWPVYVWEPIFVITAHSDVLVPNGARPLAVTVLTTNLCMFSYACHRLSMIPCHFVDQGLVSLTIFCSHCKFDWNFALLLFHCCPTDRNNFFTCHDSTAVVACTKFCNDRCIKIEVRVKWTLHRNWIAMGKPLVEWAPDCIIQNGRRGSVNYHSSSDVSILRPRLNGRKSADDIFKGILVKGSFEHAAKV